MASRSDFHDKLESILGNINVYYQPPESMKLHYPCIVYKLNSINTSKANNKSYIKKVGYSVTLIHNDPDNTIKDDLLSLPYARLSTSFTKDNLYHYAYTIFF